MLLKNLRTFVALGVLSLASAGWATTVNTSYSFTNTNVGSGLAVSVAPFDPSLGTLTQVEVVTSGAAKATIDMLNFTGAPATMTNASTNGPVTLAGPGVSVPTMVSYTDTNFALTSATSQSFVDPGAGSSLSGDVVMSSMIPAAYTGSSPISFTLTGGPYAYSETVGTSLNSALIFVGGDATASNAGVDVTYTYTPVPEPTSITLVGLCIAGLGARRRLA